MDDSYSIAIDEGTRKKAAIVLKSMGMTLNSAIHVFLTQTILQGKLPIEEIVAEPYYADELLRDMKET